MAQGQISKTQEISERTVFCADCKRFNRETSGINFNIETGEYFMGGCPKGVKDVPTGKLFANKPRHCESFE